MKESHAANTFIIIFSTKLFLLRNGQFNFERDKFSFWLNGYYGYPTVGKFRAFPESLPRARNQGLRPEGGMGSRSRPQGGPGFPCRPRGATQGSRPKAETPGPRNLLRSDIRVSVQSKVKSIKQVHTSFDSDRSSL